MKFLPNLALFLYFLSFHTKVPAQAERYCSAVFPEIEVSDEIVYGYADRHDWWGEYKPSPLVLKLYEPKSDTLSKRPLVLMVHGGVFLIGHPKAKKDILAWCDSLSHQGYVAASVGYRLGFSLLSKASMVRAGYRAIQDVRAAIRFFKEHHETYRIDTTQIYVGGNSSGTIAVLHAAFMDESERPIETYGVGKGREACDLDCLDCSGNSFQHTIEVAGIIALWGALWEPHIIDPEENIPTLLIHGTRDHVVPIKKAHPFHLPFFPTLHGSAVMHAQMQKLGIPHYYHPFEKKIHTFYHKRPLFDFPNKHWETIWNLGRDFLYEQVSIHTTRSAPPTSKKYSFVEQKP
ncbi:MAG: alpha/beta hydrolase [Bacteroidota bacterium]